MGDQTEDAPGFEYARLCELQDDVADLREAVHSIYTLFCHYRSTTHTDKAQGAGSTPAAPTAAAGPSGAATAPPQQGGAAPTPAQTPAAGSSAAATPAAATPGAGGGAQDAAKKSREFATDFQTICHLVYGSVSRFNKTQEALPPVCAAGRSYQTLAEAVPDVQGLGACRMTADEEERLRTAMEQRRSRAQFWAARTEHFDRSARNFETGAFAANGVPSLVLRAGASAAAERRQRAHTASSASTPTATAVSSSSTSTSTVSATAPTGTTTTPTTSALRPLYDSTVQASLRRQVEEARARIAALRAREAAPQSPATLPRIAVYTQGVLVPGAGAEGGEPADVVCGVMLAVPDVLCAVVPLGAGGAAAGVRVLGCDEEHLVPRAGGHTHVESAHAVFREVAAFAGLAARYFEQHRPGAALADLLVWLASYESVFSEPCAHCGTMLVAHQNMPPVCRDFRTYQPYHSTCLAALGTVRAVQSLHNSFPDDTQHAPQQ